MIRNIGAMRTIRRCRRDNMPRPLRIEPHHPILSYREVRRMQHLRFEEGQHTARSTFGRSGSIKSNTKAGVPSRSECMMPSIDHNFGHEPASAPGYGEGDRMQLMSCNRTILGSKRADLAESQISPMEATNARAR
jgi:hypothetical protein